MKSNPLKDSVEKLKFLLRPICWARTRVTPRSWPYPINGHSWRDTKEYKKGNKFITESVCMVCNAQTQSWEELGK